MQKLLRSLIMLAILAILAACGSSGGDSSPDPGATTAGVAVDPYIAGAVFQEVTEDGQVLQHESTPTDEFGRFTFPQPVRPGSILEMKVDRRGTHNGLPYQGLLKRKVAADDAGALVVSPLTTLLTNGVAPEELLSFLEEAGLPGMTTADLERDPMAGLEGLHAGEVAAEQLRNLQAAMAVNAFLHLLNDYAADAGTLATSNNRQMMADLVETAQAVLNPTRFEELAAQIDADPEMAGKPMLLGDMIRLSADAMRNVESLRDSGGPLRLPSGSEIARSVDDALASASETARRYMQERIGGGSPTAPTPGGAALYEQCAGCHKLGAYDASGAPDLAGKSALIAVKLQAGHMGVSLTPAEAATLAAWIANSGSSADPPPAPAPTDGAALYAAECQGCHGAIASTNIRNRTATAISTAIVANQGGMGTLRLSSGDLEAIAGALPAATPAPAPGPDGKALYDNRCAGCHKLGAYDASGSPDLAGKNSLIAGKLQAGHMGISLAATEVTALADWVGTHTPATDPNAPPSPPSYDNCIGCHGQPPTGTAAPNTAGAHAVHRDLPGIGTDCAVCHRGASHNGFVDLAFPSVFNAKNVMAVDNGDGTCSNISCHGGKKTPDWWTGRIDVNSQCTSCHAAGTGQYNSYNSGEHRKHIVDKRLACSACHEGGKLAAGHFTSLGTSAMEGPAGATIGGGSTRVSSYNRTTKTCATSCHENESWED